MTKNKDDEQQPLAPGSASIAEDLPSCGA